MTASVPIVSLTELDDEAFAQALGGSFERIGFAKVKDHGIDQALIDRAWELNAEFFALPEDVKRRYHRPDIAGARGYTPFGTEIAKGAT